MAAVRAGFLVESDPEGTIWVLTMAIRVRESEHVEGSQHELGRGVTLGDGVPFTTIKGIILRHTSLLLVSLKIGPGG